jgi:GNAT superfamily N-acetyltransferase
MSIQIREATAADIPVLHSLVAELADHLGDKTDFTSPIEQFEKDFNDGFFDALVADDDGEIAGMALYCLLYSTWNGRMIYLEDFVISKRHRRKGIGQLLWDALKETGREHDCKLLKWQVVAEDEGAMRFYRRQDPVFEDQWLNGKVML